MILALALAASLAAAPAQAAPGPFPYPLHRRQLANGLRVFFVPYDSPGLAAFFTVFTVGSRDEVEPGRSGFAHFFEHLSYRGTKAHSGDDWERATKSLGMDSNAFTDDDVTAYWLYGPSAALPTVIALEADRFRNLDLGEDDFKVESRAVLGELMKSQASPDFEVEEASREVAFTRHPYRHTTLGFERDVRDMPSGYQHALDFYRRLYRPDAAMVLVVGDFDEEAVFDALAQHYGPWQGKAQRAKVEPEPPQREPKEVRRAWAAPVLPRLWQGWHTPGAEDLDATAAQLVLWPLLFGPSSPLHRELVLERRLAEEIAGEFQPRRDPFLFGYELVLENAAAEAPARAAVERAVAEVAAGRVDPRALADVKANVRASLVMQTDTPYRTGVWLVYYGGLTGDPGYVDVVLRRVERLGPDDLAAFARRWLVPENRTTVVVATGGGGRAEKPAARGGAR
ncbi:M16 family metallopeptidase [Anaeromyxobacter diazotrophicus]|uniref:Peptidase M16 n=1 Tax=Anaeromyxobacter diazotrophicus TaxID=2590199 RepID=A0A7I9VME0_9BACT|nr:pitrilysin family protein [Anaeromyxobacter diazotrophicus]GEJ57573.1 peptidase M16 [Anaeromyxobacter diazotrophicus]